jgi:nucleoside-diphosphate-sugar epimerase
MSNVSNKEKKRVVVLGGTGYAGMATTEALASEGHQVISVSRGVHKGGISNNKFNSRLGIAYAQADMFDTPTMQSIIAGADSVVCCAVPYYTRWSQEFPAFTDALIRLMEKSDALLVFCDNVYAYGPEAKQMNEMTPLLSMGQKGIVRKKSQEQLESAHAKKQLRLTIGKAADFIGPGVDYPHYEKMFQAILAGKRPMIIGDGKSLHSVSYIKDVGRGLATLATTAGAEGQVWHLPVAPPMTERKHITILQQLALSQNSSKTPPKAGVSCLNATMLMLLGLFIPDVRELREVYYQHSQDFIVDCSKFEKQFGWSATPLETAFSETLAWWKQRLATLA